ncbi:MAG: PEP-CTERM sorting domain-containing protein [Betaproteobacteria bacterium]
MQAAKFLSLLALVLVPLTSQAVLLTGSQTSANEWTYDVTIQPLDNYSIFPVATDDTNLTTITVTGLYGVTAAFGPVSTDFPSGGSGIDLNQINLDWTADVLSGGTAVRWTHVGPGTGNFGADKHIDGFRIFATGAIDGVADYVTDGFSRDTTNPLPGGGYDLDVVGTVAGPVRAVPEPGSYAFLGLGLMGFVMVRKLRS